MNLKDILKLLSAIVVCQLAGVAGSLFTGSALADWYPSLIKPALNPPSWVFGPVWTTLFVLMGIAAFLIWKKGLERRDVKMALVIFLGQLILNTLWSVIFFGFRNPGLAFLEIILLWFGILTTTLSFGKISRAAMWLLLPYILWVSFAAYLNLLIWQLN